MVRRRGMTVIQEFADRFGITDTKASKSGLYLRQMPRESFLLIIGRQNKGGKTEAVRARMRTVSQATPLNRAIWALQEQLESEPNNVRGTMLTE